MNAEEFIQIHNNIPLRQHLVDVCKAMSRCPELCEDLLQEAWMRIVEAESGKTDEFYLAEGVRAMRNCMDREKRYWRTKKKYYTRTASYKRVERTLKKIVSKK